MKKIIITLLSLMILVSCDYKDANGPKVSQETLQIELDRLAEFSVYNHLYAVRKILIDGDLDSLTYEDGVAEHPTANEWIIYYRWTTGSPERFWYHVSEEPFRHTKNNDGSWTIKYHGDGMYNYQYEDISFTTTIEPVSNGWNIKVKGLIIDGEYTMEFGTDSLTIIADFSSLELDTRESYLLGSFYLVTKKGGTYLDSLKGTLSNSRQNSLHDGFYNDYVFWQYLKKSKPDWYTEE